MSTARATFLSQIINAPFATQAAFVFHDVNTRFLKQIDRLDEMQALNDEIVEAERQQVVLGESCRENRSGYCRLT